jgi:hypothetical protein
MLKWIETNALTVINLAAFLASIIVLWRTMKVAEKQAKVTSPSFCTTTNGRVYITDRTGFFVPTLG